MPDNPNQATNTVISAILETIASISTHSALKSRLLGQKHRKASILIFFLVGQLDVAHQTCDQLERRQVEEVDTASRNVAAKLSPTQDSKQTGAANPMRLSALFGANMENRSGADPRFAPSLAIRFVSRSNKRQPLPKPTQR